MLASTDVFLRAIGCKQHHEPLFFLNSKYFRNFLQDFSTEKIFEFEKTVKKIQIILIYRMFW